MVDRNNEPTVARARAATLLAVRRGLGGDDVGLDGTGLHASAELFTRLHMRIGSLYPDPATWVAPLASSRPSPTVRRAAVWRTWVGHGRGWEPTGTCPARSTVDTSSWARRPRPTRFGSRRSRPRATSGCRRAAGAAVGVGQRGSTHARPSSSAPASSSSSSRGRAWHKAALAIATRRPSRWK